MFSSLQLLVAVLAAVTLPVSAQQKSECNPVIGDTCPPNPGMTQSTLSFDFTQGLALDKWFTDWNSTVKSDSNGAAFTMLERGDGATLISKFYLFFGEVSVTMKAAPGAGIVSSVFLFSDAEDEVDWEAVGSDTTHIQTNYFGKGDRSTYDRGLTVPVSGPMDTFHTYKLTWTKDKLVWYIDDKPVRTVAYKDAKSGTRYPQTPMRIRLGIWAAGDPNLPSGTIDWAGGLADYSKAPFTMYIKDVSVVNYNPAESYTYSDRSGSFKSIKFPGSDSLKPIEAVLEDISTSTTSSAVTSSTAEPSNSRNTTSPTTSASASGTTASASGHSVSTSTHTSSSRPGSSPSSSASSVPAPNAASHFGISCSSAFLIAVAMFLLFQG